MANGRRFPSNWLAGAPVAVKNSEGRSQEIAMSSAIETVLAGSKPPWRPKVGGYVALILVPWQVHWWRRLVSAVWSAAQGATNCFLRGIVLHHLADSFRPRHTC